ncbi:MAG TPA: PAS domain S-box protein, partial [Methanocella sp.]|nr:PAS domain S-box protein [Methanocella sp.]
NDITKLKRAEESLRESEERIRMATAAARIYTWEVDLLEQNLQFSNGYEAISGYSVRPEISQGLSSFHPDNIERIYVEFMNAVEKGGDFEIEYDRTYPDTHEKHRFMNMGTVVKDNSGRPIRVIGITQDITERKRAEEALMESEEKYRSVYQQSAIGIARVGIDYRFIEVNQKFCDITGYTVKELLAKSSMDIICPEDVDNDVKYAKMLLSGQINTYSTERRYVRKDGSLIWVNLTISVVRNRDRMPHNFVSIVEDISERKQAEEELIEAKAQAELYLDLMGHDINNMHQIALGYLELIQDTQLDIDQCESLDKPIEILHRSAQLIQNVRKLQMLKEGRFQLQEVDVCMILVGVQREFGAIPHKTITLELNGYDYCYVLANELMHDVVANLASNAIKHTGNRADINISLSIVNDNGCRYCRIVVEDDGPGIHDDFKGRIFNRTLKSTDKAKGMGLGLYLVKSLVDSYNGRVWAEDRVPGDHTQGAKFIVLLPVTRVNGG